MKGFLCILYRSKGVEAEIHGRTTVAIWKSCLFIAVQSFRFNNPSVPLQVYDIHDQLSEKEKSLIRKFAVLKEAKDLEKYQFGFDTFNKIIALKHSPFEPTCLLDLDLLFTGNMTQVFDRVQHDLGVLDYPNYLRTQNRINSGVLVLKNHDVLEVLTQERNNRGDRMTEEELIDTSLTCGLLTVTKLSDIYGKSKQMWWAKHPDELTISCASKWNGPLEIDWSLPKPEFRLGDQIVRAWHFSSAKEKLIQDSLVHQYMELVKQCLLKEKQ